MGELQGRELGGYQLLDEIGGGGVAEVYRARQLTGGGPDVVVKVIFKEFARQPGFARNFAYVTEASARLANHPHILPLVAHGEDNEYLYLVAPYVKEGTLADLIDKGGRLGASDVGPFFQQLCGALSYAHSLGVVHGNVKPSNVYLHEGRHVLLGDFGLLWDVRTLDPAWSGSGVEAFEYLAPEVFDGQITQASDIYSLGATLFYALTGHPPFHMNKLGDLIAAAHQQQQPSLAQQQPPLAPAITALDPVVAQAMVKRPEERFASAALVTQSIDGALLQAAAMGVPATPPNGQQQWQPYPSTPLSAGAFNVAGSPIAPGQMNGAPGLDGFIPLTQLETNFPPLPSTGLVDEGMEQGGMALGGNLAFNPGAPQVIEPPTMRIPTPPAYQPPDVADLQTTRQPIQPPVQQPIQPPVQQPIQPPVQQPVTAPRMGPNDGAAGPMAEDLDEDDAWDMSQHMPALRRSDVDEEEAAAASGNFSPTELGLPRLTNPEMAGLPQDWQNLLTDENARRRHDPFAESQGALLPMMPPSDRLAEPYAQADAGRRGERWDDSDPGRQRANTSRRADGMDDADMAISPPRSRRREEDYNGQYDGQGADRHSRRRMDDAVDYREPASAERRVWTDRQSIVNIGKRISLTPFILAALALAIVFELAGFAVTRPDLCVSHACAVVAGEVQKYAPDLRIPGAPAPITFAPGDLKITSATDGTGSLAVTLTNSGARPVTWSASTTLSWLSVSPASGALAPGAHVRLTLTARPSGVSPGSYLAGLVVDAATGQSTQPVALTVTQGPVLAVTPAALTFQTCGDTQPLAINNSGGGKLTFTATPSQSVALSVSPASGVVAAGAQATVSVTLSCSATTGQNYAVIVVSNGGSAQATVTYG
ncbi:MAG: protein kinase [Chloroflexota bacterium]|nr:protein kinase [Chloroflexota bacterium]